MIGVALPQMSQLDGFGLETSYIDASPVIAHLDNDLIAFVIGAHRYLSDSGLAGAQPLFSGLQAMVNSVPEQVKQWLIDEVYQRPVQLSFAAADLELDELAFFGRQLSHRPIESAKDVVDHHHSHFQDALLELGDQFSHLHAGRAESGDKIILGESRLDVGHYLVHRRARYHHFAGQVQERVDARSFHSYVFGAPSLAGGFGDDGWPGGGPRARSRLHCNHSEPVRT